MASVRRQNKSGRIRSVLFILVAFFIGYSTANLFSFSEVWQWVSSKKSSGQTLASQQTKKIAKPLPKPKFEFYTLLTEENKTAGHTKKTVKLTEPTECLLCDLCTNACAYDSLKMGKVDGDYIFFMESTGAITPKDAFRKATEILKNKSKDLEAAYKVAYETFMKGKK